MTTKNIFTNGTIIIILLLIFSLITGCSSSSPDISEDLNYDVSFTVVDESEAPIEGATVTLDGSSKTTDSNGVVTFSKPNGSYDYDIILDGYQTISETTVVNGDNISIDHTLILLEPDEYNITFTITDTADTTIEGATITLDGVDNTTNDNGIATFAKTNGTYNYTVNATSYNSKSDTVVVDGDNVSESVSLTKIEYNITFAVTDTSDNAIEGATVSLDGVDKDTNSNGNAIFTKPDGTYNYSVTATEYEDITNNSLTVSGADLTETVSMQDAPIGIYNWEDLDNIRNDLYGDYILMNNLDSSTSGYDNYASNTANSNSGWLPIGDNNSKFEGKFNGNGFTIYDLYINRPDEQFIGLFGYSQSAEFINITLDTIEIYGDEDVGGIIGNNVQSLIDNCSVIGSIYGNKYVGGITGYNNAGVLNSNYTNINISAITDGFCYNIGGITGQNVSGTGSTWDYDFGTITNNIAEGSITITTSDINSKNFGGLVGKNYSGTIDNSYSIVNITIKDDLSNKNGNQIGGLVGFVESGIINNNYSDAIISGSQNVGGLIGYNKGVVSNNYSKSNVAGNQYIGGLIGLITAGRVENCYSIGNITGNNDVGGLIGKNLGGNIYDSISINTDYDIIGTNAAGEIFGRVTEAPQEHMQKDDIYTEKILTGYDDMNTIWDDSIWNFGTETDPAYPSLYWE